jgi:hypothetical protein
VTETLDVSVVVQARTVVRGAIPEVGEAESEAVGGREATVTEETAVLDRIDEEYKMYHPAGYGTTFVLHATHADGSVIYTGHRFASCD